MTDRTHYADDATLARLAQLERLEAKVKEHNALCAKTCEERYERGSCRIPFRMDNKYRCGDCPRQYTIECVAKLQEAKK